MADRQRLTPAQVSQNRRSFLQSSSAAIVGGSLLAQLGTTRQAHAAGSDVIKIGLVGCGGRGTGAANNALSAGQDIKLVAMADAFGDRLQSSRANLKSTFGDRVDVPDDRCFTGFDAYQKLIDSGVDVVLLCTPPHFRPAQLKACIDAGKHVFCEKPVAVDAPGVRSVLETAKQAAAKNLSIVSGLCWRYDGRVKETINRVRDGAIGDIVAIHETYNTGYLWSTPRREGWSDMEWQVRNWMYFTWLSGDFNVEQHVHSLDKAQWALGDIAPASAVGHGGRQVRTEPLYGNIFDHHAVVYEYPSGVKVFSYCRQQKNTAPDVSDYIYGTKGKAIISGGRGTGQIFGEKPWEAPKTVKNMYQVEHDELFNAIRKNSPINNGHYMAMSTMVAIMGRMATYSGKQLTWDAAFNSKLNFTPEKYEWGKHEVQPVALPGIEV